MTKKAKLGMVAAAVMVGLVPAVVAAGPASAATASCSTRHLGGTLLGTGDGYFFSCSGNSPTTIHVQLTCYNGMTGSKTYVSDSAKEIGYPWSFGDPLHCGAVSYAGGTKYWTS